MTRGAHPDDDPDVLGPAISDPDASTTGKSLPRLSRATPKFIPAKDRAAVRRSIASSIADAARTGDLPHEWLLRIMRGEGVVQREFVRKKLPNGTVVEDLVESTIQPSVEVRIEVAKELLPFFAPKLSAATVNVTSAVNGVDNEYDDGDPKFPNPLPDGTTPGNKLSRLADRLMQLQRSVAHRAGEVYDSDSGKLEDKS